MMVACEHRPRVHRARTAVPLSERAINKVCWYFGLSVCVRARIEGILQDRANGDTNAQLPSARLGNGGID
jgi:hypothetical protein